MSVRSGILAVLTLGPAYGLQLHTELQTRTARSRNINVGQIYSTLNRLTDAGLVLQVTRDDESHLPLYTLSAAGAADARSWMAGCGSGKPDWTEMVEHVLLVATLPGIDPAPLLAEYRASWQALQQGTSRDVRAADDGIARASDSADHHLATAALSWLDALSASIVGRDIQSRPLSTERPRRGRRPLLAGER
ncbi:MAG: hypothetical protein JWR01_1111 [Subtercola sp.]|nr:hypothetical protein [Subtercola sp.]